jgi:hypothetical protein
MQASTRIVGRPFGRKVTLLNNVAELELTPHTFNDWWAQSSRMQ